jgi:HAE1 family hydrophobic/amphiphilic exporter-1
MIVNVGVSSDGFLAQSSNNIAELNIALVPKKERVRSTDEVSNEIKRLISQIPGAKVRANPIGIFGTANQTPIQLVVSGPTYDDARKAASLVAGVVEKIPGTADVRLSSEEGKPEIRVEIDRQKMAALGLTVAEVGQTLRVAFNGDDESKFREGANEYTIRIVYDQLDRSRTSDIGSVTFMNRKGQLVELKQFAQVYQATGPTKLQRQDRNPSVTVLAQAFGRPSGSIGEDIKKSLAGSTLSPGVQIAYKGDLQNQSEGFESLGLAFVAAIIFMYMIMVALYDSYIYPFVVMFSVPVAMIGALLALALTMKSLSIFSILGIIMLVGLVGKNAILLVDRANQTKSEQKLSTFDALVEAGNTRLRPIMMTTVAMVFGMLPIAISAAAGSEWKSGLAWALIGGLISSLLLTLVLVPVVYSYVDGLRERIPVLFKQLSWTRRMKFKKVVAELQPQP